MVNDCLRIFQQDLFIHNQNRWVQYFCIRMIISQSFKRRIDDFFLSIGSAVEIGAPLPQILAGLEKNPFSFKMLLITTCLTDFRPF